MSREACFVLVGQRPRRTQRRWPWPSARYVTVVTLVWTMWLATACGADDLHARTILFQSQRVLLLGDSITAAGGYVVGLDAWLLSQRLSPQPRLINGGLPSETVSGLSEAGHAGGAFPRPDLHERLSRVLTLVKPDLIVACYGMNCGIYEPWNEAHFADYRNGLLRLQQAAESAHARLILITPPMYDDQRAPRAGFSYNEVLGRYADWVSSQTERWVALDLHHAMTQAVRARRQQEPSFTWQTDGVHPDEAGQWFIAQQLIRQLGDPAIDRCDSLEAFVVAQQWPTEVIARLRERMELRRDAYVGAAGHRRPGLAAGLPLEQAEARDRELTAQIERLTQPN